MKNKVSILSSLFVVFVVSQSVGSAPVGEGRVIVTLSGETVKTGPCGGVLEATGVGRVAQGRSRAQARLMAERAAKVRAYRNLVRVVDHFSPVLSGGEGMVMANGFLRGAKVIEKVYLPDGRVEVRMAVDVLFPLSGSYSCEEWVSRHAERHQLPVYTVDRRVEEISESEWLELNR